MKRSTLAAALAAPLALAVAAGCGDDEVFATSGGDGAFDGGTGSDAGVVPPSGGDAGTASGCGNASGAPPRLLLSMTSIGAASGFSQMVALNLQTKAIDGVVDYAGGFGTTWAQNGDPYLLEQAKDIVARLDAKEPWKVVSSWDVKGTDAVDGGFAYADPAAISVPACGKGYVVRWTRNQIAVIDTTEKSDGGAPLKFIDLSSLVQSADRDGIVEATGALYVPSKKRLYVLLGNLDFKNIASDGYTNLCATTHPSIVGIDTDTDQIVSLGGTGPQGSILLDGYNPPIGPSFVYDAALDRLLVLQGGCNTDLGDGGAGPIARRRVEEVQLATGQVRTLVALDDKQFPIGLAYGDAQRAALAFFGEAYLWNPQDDHVGAAIPGGFDAVTTDGKGTFYGSRVSYFADGGRGPVEVVSLPFTDAGAVDAASMTTIVKDPFTDNSGFISGTELWPH